LVSSRRPIASICAAWLIAVAASPAVAQQDLSWAGGSGNWDTTSPLWFNGTTFQAWDNTAPPDNAIFGAPAGNITLTVPIVVHDMTFNVGGYLFVQQGTLEFGGTDPTITTNVGFTQLFPALTGSTGFTKEGAGSLQLNGTSVGYTGVTIVNAGTLIVSNSLALGFSTAASNLVLNNGSTIVFSSPSFNHNFTLTGGIVNLQMTGVNTVMSGSPTLTASTTLNFNGTSMTGSFSGNLADTGANILSVAKNGTSRVLLSGNNTYTGPTTVSAGTLQAGSTTAFSPNSAFTVASGATLSLNNFNETIGSLAGAGTVTNGGAAARTLTTGGDNTSTLFSGVIQNGAAGSTSLTKVGTGTFVLSGANTYTGTTMISAGTLQIGNGGASGSILGDVIDDATLAFNRSNSFTFGGMVSGSGDVEQIGTGTTILTAANLYTGATTVDAGTLIVNGSIAASSLLTVNAGATIGGTGVLPSTTINGGTLAPGNGIGSVAVQGDLAFSPASTYLVEISPTASDRTNVTGTATLAGTVHVVPEAGSYAPGTTYTILNATGGVFGTFSALTFESAFLCACLSYDANNVYLTVTQTGLTFAGVGQTPNQIATGAAVEQLGTGNPIYDVVVLGTAEQARTAFDLLSGEIYPSVSGVLLYDSHYVRDAVIGRLRQPYGSASGMLAALGTSGPVVASIGHGGTAPPYALGYGQEAPAANQTAIALADSQIAAWGQALGAWGDLEGNGNAAALQRSLGGIITGFDATFDGVWRAGFAAGYTQSSLDVNARLSSGSVDAYHLALYGGGQLGALGLRTGAAYSWDDIQTARAIAFAGGGCCGSPSAFSDHVEASYTAGTAQLFGEAGYAITLGNVATEPFAGLAWVHLDTDGFSEAGGAAALTAASRSFDTAFTTLGVRAASVLGLVDGVTVYGTVGWRHAFGDVTPAMALAFASNGLPFAIAGVPVADNSLIVDAGLDLAVTATARLGINYSGQLAADAQDHAVQGNLLVQF
jgi:fibronectin-binding autotransporter adhesin